MKVTLLVPVLNEIQGMKEIMPKIDRRWVQQILVVDGGSSDGTLQYARDAGYDVIVQQKPGIRYAYIEALPHISGDSVITFSPDGNSLAGLIPSLIEKLKEGYDMVIVSRYAKGAKSYDDDMITAFGNWLFTSLINVIYRSNYTDAMVMFRGYKTELIRKLDIDKDVSYAFEERLFNTRIGCEPLISIRAAKRRLRCADIPGDEPPRIGGERKLKIIRWGLAYMFEVFREIFVWK